MQKSKLKTEEWRIRAESLMKKVDFENEEIYPDTIYGFLMAIKPLMDEAIKENDDETLRQIFGFASWCHNQSDDEYIYNAIAVGFYEHIVDKPERIESFKKYGNLKLFNDVKGLLELRTTPKILQEIYKALKERDK